METEKEMVDLSKCVPVLLPGGECPNCGWSQAHQYTGELKVPQPHSVIAHPLSRIETPGSCANCGVSWNLDAVKCAGCGFEPTAVEMYDKLMADKNRLRRAQFLVPLPVRPQVLMSTADVKSRPMKAPPPAFQDFKEPEEK